MKKKIISGVSNILIIILVVILLSVLVLNVRTLRSVDRIKSGEVINSGFASAIIGSGSMEPGISVNDLLLIRGRTDYKTGDIITYVSHHGGLVTHRIKEVLESGYITQGDANNIPDEEISRQRVMGAVIMVLPVAGGVIDGLLSPVGIFIVVCAFLFVWLIRRIRRDQNEVEDEKKYFDDIPEN